MRPLRRLLAVSSVVVIAWSGLVAPAGAELSGQMETDLQVSPEVVLAPSADRPAPVITWEGTVWFRGFESVPKAYDTTATMRLPGGVKVESVSSRQCRARDLVVRCHFGTVLSDEQKKVTVRVKVVNATVGDRLGATLEARARNLDPSPGREPIGPLVVPNEADLEVSWSHWRDSVAPGAEMSYGVRAANNGPLRTAPAVLIIKPGAQLPDPQVRVDSPNACTRTAEGFSCPFVRSISLDLSGFVSPDADETTLSTTISVEFAGDDPPADPVPGNNTLTKDTFVERRADVGTTLSLTPDTVAAADLVNEPALTYRATVTNNGPGVAHETALSVILERGLDNGIAFVSAPDGCTYDFAVQCPVGDLAVGESREYVIQAKATRRIRGERVDAEAQVTARNNEFDLPDNNFAGAVLNVPGNSADLAVDVGAEPNPMVAGDPVTIVATARNNGPLPTADALLQINLDTSLADPRIVAEGGTCRVVTDGWFECTLTGLSAQPVAIRVTGTTALNPGDHLTGRAEVRSVDNVQDNGHANNVDFLDIPVVAPPTT
ncbi:MAG TPA: hypothetical protein VFU43_16930 [Streptosporangiaceae bacterium]|nr:hypothetical protein [Streptosporangiaceae bacterium]